MAACVNITEVNSIFKWQGKLENEDERLLIIKSIHDNFPKLEEYVKTNHSYDCPEIIAMDVVQSSKEYAQWIWDSCLTDDENLMENK